MAIEHISVGDVESINKINQAIDKANLVDGKAGQSALDSEVSARATAISNETTARQQADDTEATARSAGDNVRVLYAETGHANIRPGEAQRFFTSDIDGSPYDVHPIAGTNSLVTADGSTVAINGAGIVAPIAVWRVEPGRQYRARFVVRRATDTEDPANDAVRLGLRWLRSNKAGLSTAILADLVDVFVSSGRLEYSFNFATANADNIDATSPTGAVYVRPFVRAFGSGVTNVEVIEVTDLSNAVDWSPDVSGFMRQLAGFSQVLDDLSDRMGTTEDNVEASRSAEWLAIGTLDDERLSDNVLLADAEQTIAGAKTFDAPLKTKDVLLIGDGEATGGGATARIIGDGNYFAIAPTDKAGSFVTLKELSLNPDGDAVWTAKGGFKTTGNFTVTGDSSVSGNSTIGGTLTVTGIASLSSATFSDAATTRNNLDVYNKAYVDQLIASQDAMVFKGVIDCSASPNYPAADRGWTYRVSVAGKIGGASGKVVEVGDILICLTDSSASGNQATVGANWSVIQTNIDGALTTANIGVTVQAFDADLAAVAALTPATNDFLQYKSGAWANRTIAQVRADIRSYAAVTTDADFSLTVGTNAEQIRHTGTLTANRTITLATAGAAAGAKFRVTRTGSGAFTLSIGGLKALATNTWAEAVFDGTAWFLAAYGAL